MAERKKLRKKLRDMSKENDFLTNKIATLTSENAALTSHNEVLNSDVTVLEDSNIGLMQQLHDAEAELYFVGDGSYHHNAGNCDSIDPSASGTSGEPRGEPHSDGPVALFPPVSQSAPVGNQETQSDSPFQASSAGNVTPPTSSADDSGPLLPLDVNLESGTTSIACPSSEANAGAGHAPTSPSPSVRNDSEPPLPSNITTLNAGPPFDANAGTDQGSKSPSLSNVDEPGKEEDKELSVPANCKDPSAVAGIANPALIERMSNAGIHEEDAEIYLRRCNNNNNAERAADEYFGDLDAREQYFESAGIPREWRDRLYAEKGNEVSANELWGSIKDVVQLLRISRSEEETWSFLEEERFDADGVRGKLAREAGYGKDGSRGGGDRDLGVEIDEESSEDEDPDGLYSLDD
ncbi:hypothetical protein PMIN04_006444 [Paraphaeosphaeria minitans]